MPTNVIMPQMGESIAEGTITRWLKKLGETVKRDEPLLEISTDKVDAEIPAPAAGVLLEIKFPEGTTVAINTVVAVLGEAGEASATPASPSVAAPVATPKPVAPSPAPPAAPAVSAAPAPAQEPASLDEVRLMRSSPVVRAIAQEKGIDISKIAGTGISGRVTKQDILSFAEAAAAAPPLPTAPSAPPSAPKPSALPAPPVISFPSGAGVVVEQMTPMRKKIAQRMIESKMTSAHVSTFFEVDYTNVVRARDRAKDRFFQNHGTKLSFMSFLFKAAIVGLKARPVVNASISGDTIVYHKAINLGMAVALDGGLIVPVIKNADDLSLTGLARIANDLADRARAKKLLPDDVQGGTFTITNPGVYGSLFGTPIINQPQVAILGIGTIEKRPKVVTGPDGTDAIAIRTMGYLSLTFDHRLVDGADADAFMNVVKATLEQEAWRELD
ncbi:MAG TPA: dihydrolipoamide acetyltransferase family protein [Thermoanaerobaculia bacterium]